MSSEHAQPQRWDGYKRIHGVGALIRAQPARIFLYHLYLPEGGHEGREREHGLPRQEPSHRKWIYHKGREDVDMDIEAENFPTSMV